MAMFLLFLAFCAGTAISVQAAVNGQLALAMGGNTIAAALFSFASGTLFLLIIALLRGGLPEALGQIPAQPWVRLMGGVLGAAAIFCTVLLAPKIGLGNLLTLVIAGQLLSSLLIDRYGWLGTTMRHVSLIKVGGATVMIVGVLITLFGDRLVAAASLRQFP